ncbi:FimV/HubP family polar landmark protein [Halomonas alkalicola]|uniref:FimV/HubP family polar landmark protein n=1 Tax=Halomonas alkalicola TaxID=1930622 RepID=UPI00265FC71C|nr:FimV/HubP family polar landmark protein [Halomonas alkalicola]
MKRKLTLAMLLSLSAASPLALALGLGEAEVRSTLNAPLRATLPLTDAAGIQPGLLNVSVADERAFAAAGLPRTPLAASVRLAVEQRQGRLVVELTTERPVREPWLDLLLRFDWPGGQQLREVTLLLDPPDYDQMPALVVGSRRVAAPVTSAPPAAALSVQAQAPAVRPASAPAGSGDPTWVRSGDTLWAVAGRLRPDSGISMNQMMVALVEANPEVFPSGNINAMRAGFILVVPSRERIAARSGGEADRIVAEMNQAWANRGGGAPARVALGGTAPSEPVAVSAAEASPPPEAAAAEAPAPAVEPPADADETAAEVVQPAEEQAPAASAEEPETPRLTLLTDAELAAEGTTPGEASEGGEDEAAGEAPAGEAGDGVAETGEASGAPQVMVDPDLLAALYGDGELSSDERLLRLESQWLERRDALEAVQGERDQLQEELSEMRDELATLREQLAALAAGGAGVDGPGAGGIAPPGGTPEERPWWGAIYQGELDRNLMLGGAGLAALLALWLAVRRRRRQEGAPAVAGAGPVRVAVPGAPAPGQPEASGPAAVPPAAPSVQGSLPQAEAISEADIFIAYGRYDQARELLEASLAREPERDDLRLKLLNVHLEQGNRDEVEREAARLREGGNPAVRDEVERLLARHGLPLAAAGATGAAGAAAEPAVFDRPDERAPRVFDEAGEEGGDAPGEEAQENAAPARAAPDADAYRRLASMEAPAAPEEQVPRADPGPEPELPSEPEPEPEPLQVTTRRLEDGSEIIDYRPPALDPSPAPREETPMQPGIDFTPEKGGESAPDGGEDDELPQEWEVEEVSFPPLEADNGGFSPGAAPERLAEARRLVDAGEAGRARELLAELAESDDPAIRDEARALLGRLDP